MSGNENSCPYGGHSPNPGAQCPYCHWITPMTSVDLVPYGKPFTVKKGDRILYNGRPMRVTDVSEEGGVTHLEGFFMETWVKPEMVEPSRITWWPEAIQWAVHFTDRSMTLHTRAPEGDHEIQCIEITNHFGFRLRSNTGE